MTNKYKEQIQDTNRRVYGKKTFSEIKRIGKKKGLLNVDQYKKADKNILVERIVKGKQLTDEPKSVILEQAKNEGLKVNASMDKGLIIKKLKKPELTDYTKDKLIKIVENSGVPLPSQITYNQIIQRMKNPRGYYTKKSLKRVADNNNIVIPPNLNLPETINFLEERDLITTTPIKAQEANLWVSVKNIPESLRRVVNKKARNAREAVADFKEYIKNLKKDYITPARLKSLSRQLERKIKKAVEEKERIFKPNKEVSAFRKFTTQYVIKGDPSYDPITFLKDAAPKLQTKY